MFFLKKKRKFIQNGMFFKFCNDMYGIYGSLENAQKAASHELRALNNLLNCFIPGLHFPLQTLVDWRGHRIVVTSILPVSSSTLIYGSSDGGKTIHNKSADFHELMKQICTMLNLKGHTVGRSPASQRFLYCSGDMEGHLGKDGSKFFFFVF